MNHIDRAVITGLVVLIAIAAVAIGLPAVRPPAVAPVASSPPSVAPVAAYVEGVLGRPVAASPLAAQTQPPAPKTIAVRAARLIDPKSGTTINNPVVLIEGEKVKAVGAPRVSRSSFSSATANSSLCYSTVKHARKRL